MAAAGWSPTIAAFAARPGGCYATRRMSDATAFMFLALCRPSTVGAILPSSRRLADTMAQAAAGSQCLIELGAGTGAITAALRRRHPEVPLLAVELEPRLARQLRQRFPSLEVRAAAADQVLREAAGLPGETLLASSLPFRSLPLRLRHRSSLAIERFLTAQPGRRLLQYSYLPREPFALRDATRLRWRRLGAVWGNAPPAWVWELGAATA
jgi:phosphatidylethanolamine/phosphatidyl-N-methylethanolamine N-methyltransferase